jgi:Alr-MurF fusion protein
MIPLGELIEATSASVLSPGNRDTFPGFAHDSRATQPGDCFVAVRGLHSDGHDYLDDALERSAAALLLETARVEALSAKQPGWLDALAQRGVAVLAVPDTRQALRQYASHILRLWQPRVIAVAGSAGKTTAKEAIAAVASLHAPTFRSWRNYNDLLGIPLSLGRLAPEHRVAVLEFGADRSGEIRELCEMTRPEIGVVLNVSPAHLQYFGDVATLAGELSELVRALPADGLAILNGADGFTFSMTSLPGVKSLVFAWVSGMRNLATGMPQELATTKSLYRMTPITADHLCLGLEPVDATSSPIGTPTYFPHLIGRQWVDSILAALAVAEVLDIPQDEALRALAPLQPLPGRMRWLDGLDGLTLLDDSHNAIPNSATMGLGALASIGAIMNRPRIAALGDMLHLGDATKREHEQLGRDAAQRADYLIVRGAQAEVVASVARDTGMAPENVYSADTPGDVAQIVRRIAQHLHSAGQAAPIVYIKGSEEMRMERVTAALLAQPERAEELLDRQTQAWRRLIVMRPDRPTWLEIDLDAIAANTRQIKEIVGPHTDVMVSLKADAYGHGALRVARTTLLNGAAWLGVATLSEAMPLRTAGVTAPILVFGYIPPWQAREAARLDVRATVYSADIAAELAQAARDLDRTIRVHVKVDTGMARLGLRAEDIEGIVHFVEELRDMRGVEVEGIFTHLATADSADQSYALRQLARFGAVLDALDAHGLRPPIVHAANSAATLALPQSRYSLVRPGSAIYGLAPSDEISLPAGFQPALAFKTQVAQVKDVPADEGIGYGATYITERETRIAVLPVGYADGFRRAPATWGSVLIHGQEAPLIGRVCMDQCMVDVSHIPAVRRGDEVVLIGRQGEATLSAEEVARRLGTISYEVVSALLARVPRVS